MQRIEEAANTEQSAQNRNYERSCTERLEEFVSQPRARGPDQVVRRLVVIGRDLNHVPRFERRHGHKKQQRHAEQNDTDDVVQPAMLWSVLRAYRIFPWHA
jgi:hypothetical protein